METKYFGQKLVRIRFDFDFLILTIDRLKISSPDLHFSFVDHFGEDSFFGHDAVSCLIVDGASVMALFSDLGDAKE